MGVTTNPSIFQHAISHGQAYTRQLTELAERGADAESAIRTVITDDVRGGLRRPAPAVEASRGRGRAGIDRGRPAAGRTTPRRRSAKPPSCGRSSTGPTCSSRFPPRRPGSPAITATVAEGISVNVTLIFSGRASPPGDGCLSGRARKPRNTPGGTSPESIRWLRCSSPRVDTEIDQRLEAIGTDAAMALRGQAAIANARLAYAAYQDVFEAGARYAALSYAGANVQRPLWASTGVKNPAYPDTMYVTELIATSCTPSASSRNALWRPSLTTASSSAAPSPARPPTPKRCSTSVSAVGVDLADVLRGA